MTISSPSRHILLLTIITLLLYITGCRSEEEQIKWTPSSDSDQSLPYSQNYREKLQQLEQIIMSSPDPQATLERIAAENQMAPRDLVALIQKNQRDMAVEQLKGSLILIKLRNLIVAGSLGLYQLAMRNPRRFGFLLGLVWLLVHLITAIPRTGIILSTHRFPLLSHGHSTFLPPPSPYLEQYLTSISSEEPQYSFKDKDVSPLLLKRMLQPNWMPDEDDTEGVHILKKISRSSSSKSNKSYPFLNILDSIITCNKDISLESFQTEPINIQDEEEAFGLLFSSASEILGSHRYTEFLPDTATHCQLYSIPEEEEYILLIMKKMGDWRRFGIQPFHLLREKEDVENHDKVMVYGTLRDGHFDGFLRISVQTMMDENDEEMMMVSASLIFLKNGRKLPRKLCKQMVTNFAQSIQTSIITSSKQEVVRRSTISKYKEKMEESITHKRRKQAEHDRKLEEMARERRRKWQRANPNAGAYRPSGHRMRSPNNC